jgi:hypothetical protein
MSRQNNRTAYLFGQMLIIYSQYFCYLGHMYMSTFCHLNSVGGGIAHQLKT